MTARRTHQVFFAAAMMAGCAHAPAAFPVRSAASPEAAPAAVPECARALREEPPLPGEPTVGWSGLGAPAAVDPHAGHHGHHHGHRMEATDATDAGAPAEAPHHAH